MLQLYVTMAHALLHKMQYTRTKKLHPATWARIAEARMRTLQTHRRMAMTATTIERAAACAIRFVVMRDRLKIHSSCLRNFVLIDGDGNGGDSGDVGAGAAGEGQQGLHRSIVIVTHNAIFLCKVCAIPTRQTR